MKDEEFVFRSDSREKAITARSARHTRTHCGKGGRVRLPSDNLSKKELMKMSGEVKSYRLNSPIKWKEFKAMPDDIQITYVKLLREKYDVPDCELYRMFGTDKDTLSRYFKKLGIRIPRKNVHREWKKDEFFAWLHGVKCIDDLPDPFEEEPTEVPVIEEVPIEEPIQEEPGVFVEEDLPFGIKEPDPTHPELYYALCAEIDELKKRGYELLKANEELQKRHAEDSDLIAWLQNKLCEIEPEKNRLEAQMEVVRMIFGGKNNG